MQPLGNQLSLKVTLIPSTGACPRAPANERGTGNEIFGWGATFQLLPLLLDRSQKSLGDDQLFLNLSELPFPHLRNGAPREVK